MLACYTRPSTHLKLAGTFHANKSRNSAYREQQHAACIHISLSKTDLACRNWISPWNAFEAVLALGSAATLFPTAGSARASVARPFGFVRIVRLLRYSRGMTQVGSVLLAAVPPMLTILSGIAIVAFAYAGTHIPLLSPS